MTQPDQASPAVSDAAPQPRLSGLFGNTELIVVILLGIVSVAMAIASFQAQLHTGKAGGADSRAQNAQTEAESLFLEANQLYLQDVETWARLTDLGIDMESGDPEVAAAAATKLDLLYFVAVDEVFYNAIAWSEEQSAAIGAYVSPFESQEYHDIRFGAYTQERERSANLRAEAAVSGGYADRLQLNTVLMAVALFLLGVAAVVKRPSTQWVLIGFGVVVFAISLVLHSFVPFVWL